MTIGFPSKSKELEIILSKVPRPEKAKERLEQYPTPPDVASKLLWTARMRGDLDGTVVVDLGCGTGVLTVGAALCGAGFVVGLDIDEAVIEKAKVSINQFNIASKVDLILADARRPPIRKCDVVVMNPPFGVKRRHADVEFLVSALKIAARAVYSIHKASPGTSDVINRYAKAMGFTVAEIGDELLAIPQIMEKHVKKVHRVRVTLYAIIKNP